MEIQTYSIQSFLILFVSFHGFFLAALISIGQLIATRKSIKNWLFLGLFIVFSLFQVHYFFFEIGWLNNYPIINTFPNTAFYLIGPLLYLITKHSLNRRNNLDIRQLLHFLPATIASALSIFLIYFDGFENTSILSGYFFNTRLMVIGAIGWFFFILYVLCSVKALRDDYLISTQTTLNHPPAMIVAIIIAFLMTACIFDLLALITDKKVFIDVSVMILTLMIIFLFLINFKYPGYDKILYGITEKERKKRSYLKGINLKELNLKLNHLMEVEEIFTDEKLSLPGLSRKLNISPHQLSQYLNDKRGDNFAAFINQYRVKKAKKMLVADPDKKILAIAFDVGFQSKSTFNAAFAKFAKMTPHEYRRKKK